MPARSWRRGRPDTRWLRDPRSSPHHEGLSLQGRTRMDPTGHACTVLEKRTSTGKVRPLMWNTGTLPKKSENFWLSSVALVTTSLKSRLLATTCTQGHRQSCVD